MNPKQILKIALVPILIAVLLFSVQIIFGWLSEPSNTSVIKGIISIALLILATYFIIRKIYFNHD